MRTRKKIWFLYSLIPIVIAIVARQALPPVETDLIVELSRHHYSEEYIALTREFYLKME